MKSCLSPLRLIEKVCFCRYRNFKVCLTYKNFSHVWVSKQTAYYQILVQDIHYTGRDLSNDHFAETNKDLTSTLSKDTVFNINDGYYSIWSKVCQKD